MKMRIGIKLSIKAVLLGVTVTVSAQALNHPRIISAELCLARNNPQDTQTAIHSLSELLDSSESHSLSPDHKSAASLLKSIGLNRLGQISSRELSAFFTLTDQAYSRGLSSGNKAVLYRAVEATEHFLAGRKDEALVSVHNSLSLGHGKSYVGPYILAIEARILAESALRESSTPKSELRSALKAVEKAIRGTDDLTRLRLPSHSTVELAVYRDLLTEKLNPAQNDFVFFHSKNLLKVLTKNPSLVSLPMEISFRKVRLKTGIKYFQANSEHTTLKIRQDLEQIVKEDVSRFPFFPENVQNELKTQHENLKRLLLPASVLNLSSVETESSAAPQRLGSEVHPSEIPHLEVCPSVSSSTMTIHRQVGQILAQLSSSHGNRPSSSDREDPSAPQTLAPPKSAEGPPERPGKPKRKASTPTDESTVSAIKIETPSEKADLTLSQIAERIQEIQPVHPSIEANNCLSCAQRVWTWLTHKTSHPEPARPHSPESHNVLLWKSKRQKLTYAEVVTPESSDHLPIQRLMTDVESESEYIEIDHERVHLRRTDVSRLVPELLDLPLSKNQKTEVGILYFLYRTPRSVQKKSEEASQIDGHFLNFYIQNDDDGEREIYILDASSQHEKQVQPIHEFLKENRDLYKNILFLWAEQPVGPRVKIEGEPDDSMGAS